MRKATAPIPLAGCQIDETRRVRACFNSEDERDRVLLPFIKDGLDRRFDQDRMLTTFEVASGHDQGDSPCSGIVCSMDGASDEQPHLNDLIELESRVNELWDRRERRAGQAPATV